MQFLCDICGCNLFYPLYELQGKILEDDNKIQLITKENTLNLWKCEKCGEVYSPIIINKEGD